MIKFGQLDIEGFCSIDKLSINLSGYKGVTLIKGENGAGKTTILSAINWILYGKTLKDGVSNVNTKKKYQPSHYKGTMGSIFFEKNNITHQIIRCSSYTGEVLGSKGKDTLHYIVDGSEIEEKKKYFIQQAIIDDLGMSAKLFSSSIMFGQGVTRLIQESGTDKKKLFEEVFEIGYLNIARNIAQKYRDAKLDEYNELKRCVDSLVKERDSAESTYSELKEEEDRFSESVKEEVKEVKASIKEIECKIKDLEYSPTLLAKATKKLEKHENKLKQIKADFDKNQSKVKHALSIDGLSELIDGIAFHINTGKTDKALAKLSDLRTAIVVVNNYNDIKGELQGKINTSQKEIFRLKSVSRLITSSELQLQTLELRLKKLKNKKKDILSPKYKKKAKQLKEEIDSFSEKVTKLKEEVDNYNWVIQDPLGNNGIKTYIFESSLDMLNKALNRYSDILGFRVEFGVDLNTTKKDFYTLIEIEGEILDYDELSGGQKQLINIAMAFAMHESCTYSKGINILFLDEVFESLCRSNIEIVLELIKSISMDKSVFLITHQDSLPLSNSKTILVERKNKLSKFTF